MVNPDGVIHGNSRCNLAGLDLNRNWMDTISKVTQLLIIVNFTRNYRLTKVSLVTPLKTVNRVLARYSWA